MPQTDKFGDPIHVTKEEVAESLPQKWDVWQDVGIRVVAEQELTYDEVPFVPDTYPADMLARIFEIVKVESEDMNGWYVTVKEPHGASGIPDRIVTEKQFNSKESAIEFLFSEAETYVDDPSMDIESAKEENAYGLENQYHKKLSYHIEQKTPFGPIYSMKIANKVMTPVRKTLDLIFRRN